MFKIIPECLTKLFLQLRVNMKGWPAISWMLCISERESLVASCYHGNIAPSYQLAKKTVN